MEAIHLNDEEQKLFSLLKSVVREMDLSTELRCAGGWVRDKLLGRESNDIDIAIDNMMGEEFANKLNEYLVSRGEEKTNVAVIHSNPDQSKHLETAKVKYQGLEIDFVNLRSESYASSSRIPEIQFGTAEEDAMRRDFTINALFYNIGHGNVEDLTKRGLEDLRSELIRTPLPARQTFMDDPLRVMRAIRFASRLGFDLDADIMAAASSAEVKEALMTKVSRERISTEFEATLEGPNPRLALQLIRSFGLLDVVLNIPEGIQQGLPAGYAEPCIESALFMAGILRAGNSGGDKSQAKLGIVSALLLPLRDFTAQEGKKKREVNLPEHIVGLSLKKKKDAAAVGVLQRAAADIVSVSRGIVSEAGDSSPIADEDKIKLGLAIRSTKEHWRMAGLLSYLFKCPFGRSLNREDENGIDGEGSPSSSASAEDLVDKCLAHVSKVEDAAVSLKLDRAWEIRPLINGKDMMKLLNAKGPIIGKAVTEMTKWQLAHPEGTAEECKSFLVNQCQQEA